MNFTAFCDELENQLKEIYENGVTIEDAEKLAAKFLYANLQVSKHLKIRDLDARMRKAGVKTVKSKVRTDEVSKHDKKPAEGTLDDIANLSEVVQIEQSAFDAAEVDRDELQRLFDTFHEAHVYLRGVAKGNMG